MGWRKLSASMSSQRGPPAPPTPPPKAEGGREPVGLALASFERSFTQQGQLPPLLLVPWYWNSRFQTSLPEKLPFPQHPSPPPPALASFAIFRLHLRVSFKDNKALSHSILTVHLGQRRPGTCPILYRRKGPASCLMAAPQPPSQDHSSPPLSPLAYLESGK